MTHLYTSDTENLENIYKGYRALDVHTLTDEHFPPCVLCNIGESLTEQINLFASSYKMKKEMKAKTRMTAIDRMRRIMIRRLPKIFELAFAAVLQKGSYDKKDKYLSDWPWQVQLLASIVIAEMWDPEYPDDDCIPPSKWKFDELLDYYNVEMQSRPVAGAAYVLLKRISDEFTKEHGIEEPE